MTGVEKKDLPKSLPTIHGVYWETEWFPAFYVNGKPVVPSWRYRSSRPCRGGLSLYYEVPPGEPFKICFARLSAPPMPWAHTSYYLPIAGQSSLRLFADATPYQLQLMNAGLAGVPLQWWVEYAEHEEVN